MHTYTPPPLSVDEEDPANAAAERAPLLSGNHTEAAPLQSAPQAAPTTRPAAAAPAPPAEIPDIQTYWQLPRNKWLLGLCLTNSIIILFVTLGSPYLALAMLSGFIGVPATAVHVLNSLRGKFEVASRTRTTSVLSMLGLVLALVSMLQLSWLTFLTNWVCRTDPADASPKDCMTDYAWLGATLLLVLVQAVLFKQLLERSGVANRLLNPVSSGLVAV